LIKQLYIPVKPFTGKDFTGLATTLCWLAFQPAEHSG